MKEIYFDNAATTKVSSSVIKIVTDVMSVDYGNPSSLHKKGMKAEKYLKETSKIISKILNAEEKEIYYTSGGSESNNLAILGVCAAYNRTGRHIITTTMEHAATSNPIKFLEENGWEVTYLSVDKYGKIDIEELKGSIRKDTVLVSIMHVNNEIGTILDIETIGRVIKEKNSTALFHIDAIQSFGKLFINVKKSNIDLLSISGHKFHGPKGIGAIYIKNGTKVKPQILGGGQQKGLRSGTQNVPGIAGLGVAAKEAYENIKAYQSKNLEIKKALADGILKNIDGVNINGLPIEESASHILNLTVNDIRGEVLLHSLETEGIFVSTGSACSSNKASSGSKTLRAIGLDSTDINSSIRFSFSKYNYIEEVNQCLEVLKRVIPKLRMFTAGGRR